METLASVRGESPIASLRTGSTQLSHRQPGAATFSGRRGPARKESFGPDRPGPAAAATNSVMAFEVDHEDPFEQAAGA